MTESLFDLIAEALDNSMDVDWSSSVGARYVVEALETVGVTDASLRAKLPLEDMARRLRAAYIVVTQSTMWPTDEQFLEMLTLMSKVGPVPGQGALDDVSAAAEKAYAILCSGEAPYSARECKASAVLSEVISDHPPVFAQLGDTEEYEEAYDRGRRDMLNAILALNPEVAQRLHDMTVEDDTPFKNEHGKIPFDVLFWVGAVAEQLGIEPKDDGNG